jgi:hypothetical protein
MTSEELRSLVERAEAVYQTMTPSQKLRHDYMQRRSFSRGMGASKMPHDVHCAAVDQIMPHESELTDAEIGLALMGKLPRRSPAPLPHWDKTP